MSLRRCPAHGDTEYVSLLQVRIDTYAVKRNKYVEYINYPSIQHIPGRTIIMIRVNQCCGRNLVCSHALANEVLA